MKVHVFCFHQYIDIELLLLEKWYTIKYQHTIKYQNTIKYWYTYQHRAHFKKQSNFVSVDNFGFQTGEAGKPIM